MHLKMDSWHSEWLSEEDINRELSTPIDSIPLNSSLYSVNYTADNSTLYSVDYTADNSTLYSVDNTADSFNLSRDDSIESGGEEIVDKNDTSVLKPTFKSVLQAKKRLQAFSAIKQLKRSGSKDEKTEDGDKGEKSPPKKSKKAVYPGDKAKAVIKEIEEIKKHEAREEKQKYDALIQTTLRSMMQRRSRSLSPEKEKHFKRREIKSRNYRRSDSFNRKSASPEDHGRRSDRSPPRKAVYPRNWEQYKQQNLTLIKDEELKLKLFPKQKYSQHELVSRLFNFTIPSPLLDSFKYFSLEEKHENVPVSFMRVTRTKPPLTYSVNIKQNKESFVTRNQLFQIISRERRAIIENLINTPSRCQLNEKPMLSRQWYSKSWKKTSDAECKILENSVGLSFLQNYSDEEEEIETEEIVICSSTKESSAKKTQRPDIVIDSSVKDNDVKETVQLKETIPLMDIVEIRKPRAETDISIHTNVVSEQILEKQATEKDEKENLKQEQSEESKRHQQNELKQTRKAIRELEEELERRKAIKTEEEAREKRKVRKKRKKKVKKKQESSDAEEAEEEAPKRKKRKNKSKKKKYVEEDSYSSEDEKRKKKKNKKTGKHKKDKSKKKKENSKKEEMPVKEHKAKRKDDDTEEGNLKENKKKKKKSNIDDPNYLDEKSTLEEPKVKNRKKSKKKKEKSANSDSQKESVKNTEILTKEDKKKHNKENEEEYMKEPVENSSKKRRRKNRWRSGDSDVIEEIQFYEFEKTEKSDLNKSKHHEENHHKPEPKQIASKVDKIRSTSREKSSKFEKEKKRLSEEYGNKSKEHEVVVSERDSRKYKDNVEKSHKLEENSKKKKESEEVKEKEVRASERIEDGSNKKHSERGHQKEDLEKNRKYGEKSEKRDSDGKSNRDRRTSDAFEKSDQHTERNHSSDRIKDKHQKEKRHKEEHPETLERVVIKQEPDWENLRSKRKRHRNSDSKEPSKDLLENLDLPEDLEAFPLEKEIFNSKEEDRNEIPNKRSRDNYRRETDTPDTDEYRENWEKDIFPIWESEDEAPPKPREKLNNSWESDEEIFERGLERGHERGVVESSSSRPFNTTFDLEIPLNIKPFKRREVIDTDTELQLLKREGQTLSEERRRLEIEKLRVKELELKVIREVESKVKEQYKSKVTRDIVSKAKEDYKPKVVRELENKSKENQHKSKVREVESKAKEDQCKTKVVKEVKEDQCKTKVVKEAKQDQLKTNIKEVQSKLTEDEPEVIEVVEKKVQEDQHKPPNQIENKEEKVSKKFEQEKREVKKGRWDKKVAQPRMSTPKVDVIEVGKLKKDIPDEDDSLTNVSSTTSLNNSSAVLENEYEEFMKAVSSSTERKKRNKASKEEMSSFESSSFESSDSESSSSKNSQAKKRARNDKNPIGEKFVFKNIITNLDELNLPQLDSPSKQNNIMILPQDIPLIPMPLPQPLPQTEIKPVPVPSPSIDIDKIPKPMFSLGLSANITLDIASNLTAPGVDSPSGKSLEFINPSRAAFSAIESPKVQKIEEVVSSRKPDYVVSFASPLTDASLDSVLFEDKPIEKDEIRLNDKPFVFTSMVLPSKRSLLNNSNLNFGDSEDEDNAAKSMKKLEEIIKENLTDSAKVSEDKEKAKAIVEKAKEVDSFKEATNIPSIENRDNRRSRSPASNRTDLRRQSNERVVKRDVSPKRTSSARRDPSPRRRIRESSPKRRGPSPRRNSSPRKRTPPRRRNSPVKRKYSPRRSTSPRLRRRHSISPPRKLSPKRSVSPRSLPKTMKSKSPEKSKSSFPTYKLIERLVTDSNRRKSPLTITSPLEGLKRSVADSTISDDLLPQPSANIDEYTESPVSRFYDRTAKLADSPKRVPLDIRINQVLGLGKEEPKPISTTYSGYSYEQTQYHQQFSQQPEQKSKVMMKQTKGSFVQVGNMVRIVPTEDIPIEDIPIIEPSKIPVPPLPSVPPREKPVVAHKKEKKSQIVQVGNMLQIVPADMLPEVPLPPEPKPPKPRPQQPKLQQPKLPKPKVQEPKPPKVKPPEPKLLEPKREVTETVPETSLVTPEKQSAETVMRLKVAERRAERDKRRQERERRRKEKEKRRKEKEKQRQIKLKQRTENMIKKALQLEVEGGDEEEELLLNETPTQWPPLPVIISSVSKEVGKSILIRGGQSKTNVLRSDKTKIVQFADGVRPGEGTSPSGGEELSSPPPVSKKLPKEKRYKKTKLLKKNPKKKVKVKVIKKRPENEESDEEDNLPPPSPPPGSPPPHLFPPRIKPQTINNIHAYIPNVVPIQPSHNQQMQASHNQQLYRPPPQLNIIMHPPHPPHHHGPPPPPALHHGPPPPPTHHGPPPPPIHHGPPPPSVHHGPPHHGPPLPPLHHHGPPPSPHHHHHGPPVPPGPPHFHHGPLPPPGPPHHHGPPLPLGPPGHHHHHGPPQPYHH